MPNTAELDALLESFDKPKQKPAQHSKAMQLSLAMKAAENEPYEVTHQLITVLTIHCQTCHLDKKYVADIREGRLTESGKKLLHQVSEMNPSVKVNTRNEPTQQVVLCTTCYGKQMEEVKGALL